MKKGDSLLKMVISLGVITCVSAALLAWVYSITADPIKQAEREKQAEAIKAVTPVYDNDPIAEEDDVMPVGEPAPLAVFPARRNGNLVGAAVESYSSDGFSGEISVMYGFDMNGNVTGYEVLNHTETPGLGDKMNEWFRDSLSTQRNIIGKDPAKTDMKVSKDGGDIDGITAATITSRAFLDALRRAHSAFIQYRDSEKQ